jgi:hypothetical protein
MHLRSNGPVTTRGVALRLRSRRISAQGNTRASGIRCERDSPGGWGASPNARAITRRGGVLRNRLRDTPREFDLVGADGFLYA